MGIFLFTKNAPSICFGFRFSVFPSLALSASGRSEGSIAQSNQTEFSGKTQVKKKKKKKNKEEKNFPRKKNCTGTSKLKRAAQRAVPLEHDISRATVRL